MASAFANINGSYIDEFKDYLLRPLTDNPTFQELGFEIIETPHTTIKPKIYFSAGNKYSKAYASGWTGSTAETLQQKSIVLAELKAERAWDKHDVEGTKAYADANRQNNNIHTGDPYMDGLVLQFSQGVKNDITRIGWLGDTEKDALVTVGSVDVPDNATPDTDYNVVDGLWTCLQDNASILRDGSTASSITPTTDQVTRLVIANGTVAQISTSTLTSMTAGTMIVTINGVAYSEAFVTSNNATVTAWLASHKTTIETANTYNSEANIVVTEASGVITVTSQVAGMPFSLVGTDGGTGGGWVDADSTANTGAAALGTDEAKSTMRLMWAGAPKPLRAFANRQKSIMRWYVTSTFYDNYLNTLEDLGETESSWRVLTNGERVLSYKGIPLIEMPQWDEDLSNDFADPFPHRAILTYPQNLQVAMRNLSDHGTMEFDHSFRNNTLDGRAQYYMGTGFALPEHIVMAY